MSKESMEITINTSKWHEHAKQWNDNSHISSLKLTGSHFIVILFTHKCQLYIWEQSHPFSSIVAFVYKLLHIPCIFTSNLYSNVTTSTRINSSNVHMYICVCFIQNSYNTFQFHSAMVCWPIIQHCSCSFWLNAIDFKCATLYQKLWESIHEGHLTLRGGPLVL